jgi:hypothetical protein
MMPVMALLYKGAWVRKTRCMFCLFAQTELAMCGIADISKFLLMFDFFQFFCNEPKVKQATAITFTVGF